MQRARHHKLLHVADGARQQLVDSLQKIEELKAEKPGLMGKLEKAVRSHEIAQKQMEIIEGEVKEETERLRAQLDEKREETKPVVQESTERKAAFDESSAEIKMVKERVRTARQRNVEANAALRRAVETKENHAGTIERLMKERTEATDRLNEAEAEKAEVTAAEADAQDAARAARTKMEECRARMNKAESLQGMAKALADAQKPGNKLANAGLLGRLGDLGAIDQKYDVAITTACSALNYLVTRDARSPIALYKSQRPSLAP